MTRTEPLERPKELAGYQLVARLDRGRMGTVYKAKSHGVEGFEKVFVVKLIDPDLAEAPSFVDILIEEAKRDVNLSHANVAQVHDLGRSGRDFYIATEYVDGLDLGRAQNLADRADRSWRRELVLFVVSEVAKGLDYAHRRKDFSFESLDIIHRHLTPRNVMLSFDGEVKITDFGLARAFQVVPPKGDRELVERHLYSAPEVFIEGEYSQRGDLFSLGLILYEWLAGVHPYRADSPEETLRRIERAEIPPVTEYADVGRPVRRVLEAMLSADPDERIDTASAVYEQIVGYLFNNNLKADNRSLGLLMKELRRDEKRLDPERDVRDAGTEIVDWSEVEANLAGESSVAGQGSEAGAKDVSETSTILPSDKIQRARAESDKYRMEALPDVFASYFRAVRQKRGKALLVSGDLGKGQRYLADRLVDSIDWGEDVSVFGVQTTEDDRYSPFGVLGNLILRALSPAAGKKDGTPRYEATLEKLRKLDADPRAVSLLEALWGVSESVPEVLAERTRLLGRLFRKVVDHLSGSSAVVIVIDRIEKLDPTSIDVLRELMRGFDKLPVLLVMTTEKPDESRARFNLGEPGDLHAIHVEGESRPELSDIQNLTEAESRVLLMIALYRQPLPQDVLALLTAMPEHEMIDALESLLSKGFIRAPRTGVFVPGVSTLGAWAESALPEDVTRKVAAKLTDYLRESVTESNEYRAFPTLIRVCSRTGRRRQLRRLVDRYRKWLEQGGWYEVSFRLVDWCTELFSDSWLERHQNRIEDMIDGVRLALSLLSLNEARDRLEPLRVLAKVHADTKAEAYAALLEGQTSLYREELGTARRLFLKSFECGESLREPKLILESVSARLDWAMRVGQWRKAQDLIVLLMNVSEQIDASTSTVFLEARWRYNAVRIAHERNTPNFAATFRRQLDTIARQTHSVRVELYRDLAEAEWAIIDGKLDEAHQVFETASKRAGTTGLIRLQVEAVSRSARVAYLQRQWHRLADEAERLHQIVVNTDVPFYGRLAEEYRTVARIGMEGVDDAELDALESGLEHAKRRNIARDIARHHRHLQIVYSMLGQQKIANRHSRGVDKHRRAVPN